MSIEWYQGVTFRLDSTTGEATDLFGAAPTATDSAPRFRIDIAGDSTVTLTLLTPPGERALNVAARYIDGDHFDHDTYPDPLNDIVIGHFDFGNATLQQLFLLWVRPNPGNATAPLKLGLFIFDHKTRFSGGADGMFPGVGQQNGGGSGTGPH